MKLPSKVKINTYTYSVEEVVDPMDGSMSCWGYCNYDEQKIIVKKNATIERKRNILLHEIMHAVFESVHASPGSMRSEEVEEYYVVHSAPILVDVLRDNPAVVKYLVSKD